MTTTDMTSAAARHLERALDGRTPPPRLAIVLGSGLGGLTDRMTDTVRVPYQQIPGFHAPSVEGHKGEIVIGTLGAKTVMAQSGRFHLYEGHDANTAALPIRAFAALGIETLIVTNAAGGIRRTFRPGTLMLIADQLNLTFRNPLFGPVRSGEERFPDMSAAYDPDLRSLARAVARKRGIILEEGVYAGLLGPSYETPAEIRMLERMGADAVGMSTVLETIAARANGIRCLGISTITNPAAGITTAHLSHQEVMDIAGRVGEELGDLVEGVVEAA